MTVEATAISLDVGCESDTCEEVARPLYLQLSSGGYDACSVLQMPESVEAWRDAHRTARKRANRAERLGYRFETVQRENHGDDIYRINTSLKRRQGRSMTENYSRPQLFSRLPDYACDRHRVSTYGVLARDGQLVAYMWLYRAGDLALVSSILGHGDHLENDVMYLLAQGVIGAEAGCGGFLVYNRHDSGTDGLRYYKERIGFQETHVEWLP